MPDIVVTPDRTEDIPEQWRRCNRCNGKGTTVWVNRAPGSIVITLCNEHVPDHVPGMVRHDWFRVEFNDRIEETEDPEPKRKARLVRSHV